MAHLFKQQHLDGEPTDFDTSLPVSVPMPKMDYYTSYEQKDLASWDFENLPEYITGWYWYGCGGYEGGGNMILKTPSGWARANLSHCSCNGPTENPFEHFESLEQLVSGVTPELLYELQPLLDAIGYVKA